MEIEKGCKRKVKVRAKTKLCGDMISCDSGYCSNCCQNAECEVHNPPEGFGIRKR